MWRAKDCLRFLVLLSTIVLSNLLFSPTGQAQPPPDFPFIDAIYEGNGLEGVSAVVASPDGKHIYVTAADDHGVTLFQRNDTTGRLAHIKTYRDGVDGLDGLGGAADLVLSGDGRHLYVAGKEDNSLVLFNRNSVTGQLTLVEALAPAFGNGFTPGTPAEMELSPGGKHLYVSEMTTLGKIFSRDPSSGHLNEIGLFANSNFMGGLTMSSDGKNMYVVNGANGLSLLDQLNRNPTTGLLSYEVNYQDDFEGSGLSQAYSAVVSADGKYLYLTDFNTLALFSRDTTTGNLTYLTKYVDGNGVEGLGGTPTLVLSSDDTSLYVISARDRSIALFERDKTTGLVSFIKKYQEGQANLEHLSGATTAAFSPDGGYLYLIAGTDSFFNRGADALTVFSRNGSTGTLTFVEAHSYDTSPITGLRNVLMTTVSPDGKHLYSASASESLAAFQRSASSGLLSQVETKRNGVGGVEGLGGLQSVVVSPDGKHVYTVGADLFTGQGAVATFNRNNNSGALTFVGALKNTEAGFSGLYIPADMAISPDGKHLYAIGEIEDSVVTFSRDEASGLVSWVETITSGAISNEGLNHPTSIVVSPEGNHVYVVDNPSFSTGNLAVFDRNITNGKLTFKESLKQGEGNVAGLAGISWVRIDPDGKQLYVISIYEEGVATFNRDPATGKLTFVGLTTGSGAQADVLKFGRKLAISPDGKTVMVTSDSTNSVVVLDRDPASGGLAISTVYKNHQDGVHGLGRALGLSFSPDNNHAYIAAVNDDAIAIFGSSSGGGPSEATLYLPVIIK